MANIQKQFEKFHDTIRLNDIDDNQELREKRDVILKKLSDSEDLPPFKHFNQGSYAMSTGIKPVDGDYDIDVGLRFQVKKADYPNPVDLKVKVAKALEGHTNLGSEVRRPCVTVKYTKDGEQAYHVDLAVYAYEDPDADESKLFLSKGKLNSDESRRIWEESDPQALLDEMKNKYEDKDERAQFRRTIRLLKRWKNEKFCVDGNGAPTGIAFTIAALEWFRPSIETDYFSNKKKPDDRAAVRYLVDSMISNFVQVSSHPDTGAAQHRLKVLLPFVPNNDLFEKMTDSQMTTFRERLLKLRDVLDEAGAEADPHEAAKLMQKELGDDFPVPEKEETAQSRGRAIASSGVSA